MSLFHNHRYMHFSYLLITLAHVSTLVTLHAPNDTYIGKLTSYHFRNILIASLLKVLRDHMWKWEFPCNSAVWFPCLGLQNGLVWLKHQRAAVTLLQKFKTKENHFRENCATLSHSEAFSMHTNVESVSGRACVLGLKYLYVRSDTSVLLLKKGLWTIHIFVVFLNKKIFLCRRKLS